MLQETDSKVRARLSDIFFRRPLPQFDTRLFDWLDHPDRDLRWAAQKLLGNTPHPMIREEALRRKNLKMLVASVQEGDAAAILAMLAEGEPTSLWEHHGNVSDLVEMYENSPHADAQAPLLWAYDRAPCSNCRGSAIEALAARWQLPQWIRDEAPHDCSETVRAFGDDRH